MGPELHSLRDRGSAAGTIHAAPLRPLQLGSRAGGELANEAGHAFQGNVSRRRRVRGQEPEQESHADFLLAARSKRCEAARAARSERAAVAKGQLQLVNSGENGVPRLEAEAEDLQAPLRPRLLPVVGVFRVFVFWCSRLLLLLLAGAASPAARSDRPAARGWGRRHHCEMARSLSSSRLFFSAPLFSPRPFFLRSTLFWGAVMSPTPPPSQL